MVQRQDRLLREQVRAVDLLASAWEDGYRSWMTCESAPQHADRVPCDSPLLPSDFPPIGHGTGTAVPSLGWSSALRRASPHGYSLVRQAVGDRARRRGCWIAPEAVTTLHDREASRPGSLRIKRSSSGLPDRSMQIRGRGRSTLNGCERPRIATQTATPRRMAPGPSKDQSVCAP